MRLLVDIIDWDYPKQRVDYQPMLWDLRDRQIQMNLVLAFANGIILEFRVEAETQEGLDIITGIAIHTGSCKKITPGIELQDRLWLFDPAYDCYQQGTMNPGYIFIHPIPQPQKFLHT